jgi:hypothetical protein
MTNAHGLKFKVTDVQSFGVFVLHIGTVKKGQVKVGHGVRRRLSSPSVSLSCCNYGSLSLPFALSLGDVITPAHLLTCLSGSPAR